ncbi:MAG: CopG family transcriptional regulator [Thermoprotei archaeon]|nr:MAG: CopG family transcriptional regulator [Thermoprotei archaeon]
MRVVTFKLPERLLEQLDTYAIKTGMNRSDIIRLAIKNFIRESSRPRPKYRVKRVVLT